MIAYLPDFIGVRIGPPDPEEGCRFWTGRTDYGYPAITTRDVEFSPLGDPVHVQVVRVVYETIVGPLPANRWVSHLCHDLAIQNGTCERGECRHRRCLEPTHMYLGIPSKRRGLSRQR